MPHSWALLFSGANECCGIKGEEMAQFIEEHMKEIITPSGYYESKASKSSALCFPELAYRTK